MLDRINLRDAIDLLEGNIAEALWTTIEGWPESIVLYLAETPDFRCVRISDETGRVLVSVTHEDNAWTFKIERLVPIIDPLLEL